MFGDENRIGDHFIRLLQDKRGSTRERESENDRRSAGLLLSLLPETDQQI